MMKKGTRTSTSPSSSASPPFLEAKVGGARAVWTNRRGGVSAPPFDTLNLALSSDDTADAVTENRRRLARQLDLSDPAAWWWLRQVHDSDVVVADGRPPDRPPAADAVVTAARGAPMVVMTADCAPIAIACDGAAGVVHAGWHGLLAGVVESAVAQLRSIGGHDVTAVLGPCIHAGKYEFGLDDLARMTSRFGSTVAGRTDDGRSALDLPAAVRAAFEQVDVSDVDNLDICTASSSDYFSYRRDGNTGRQALVVVLAE